MKTLIILLSVIISQASFAVELLIKSDVNPQIHIIITHIENGKIKPNQQKSISIEPSGKASWFGFVSPKSIIKNNDFDWEKLHKDSTAKTVEYNYSSESYKKILLLCKTIVENEKPTNNYIGNNESTKYKSVSITFWLHPNINYAFNVRGDEQFPKEIKRLLDYINELESQVL